MILNKIITKLTRTQLETAKFGFYLLTPIFVMYYVGIDTDKKFNVPGFWPDPKTLNDPPVELYEIEASVYNIKKEKLEKKKRLEQLALKSGSLMKEKK